MKRIHSKNGAAGRGAVPTAAPANGAPRAADPPVCVILAAGAGTRMRSRERHKVCFPIAGVPAILRTLRAAKAAGLRRLALVVGQMAEQVAGTVAPEHPEVAYVYQPQPRGTGHAAACAAAYLQAAGHDGDVMVTMGDKVLSPGVIERLVAMHAEGGADVTFAALPKDDKTTAGRIVRDGRGAVLGVVERAEIIRAAAEGRHIALAGRRLAPARVEASATVCASLYLFRAKAFYEAVAALEGGHPRGELYLTDAVERIAAAGGAVRVMDVVDAEDLMAFNTPEELLRIEEVFARRASGRRRVAVGRPRLSRRICRPAGEWLEVFRRGGPELQRALEGAYGSDRAIIRARKSHFVAVLGKFVRLHGADRPAILARAPGRVNLMGRHVDHRGGYVNVMAINREVVLAAAPRADDTVRLSHVDEAAFPDRAFRIGELLRAADWMDWMDFLNSATVRQVLEGARGDWSNYAKAAVLRLQHGCPDRLLAGMDCVFSGDIPMGAGLSSSSAVVVAAAEAAVALNGLDVTTRQFVDLCGEGEWFVGSRGGSADHAAIRSGRRGRVLRVGFFPFRIEESVPLPPGLALVIANSRLRASKSEGARDTFNHRVAAYNLCEMILRKRVRALRSLEHLRDLSPAALGVSEAEVYRLLGLLPRELSRRAALRLLGDERKRLDEIFSTHVDVGPYRLRDVAMFGVCECQRSRAFSDLLVRGDLGRIGLFMRISHDGDRVVRHDGTRLGRAVPHAPAWNDAEIARLMRDSASDDPVRHESAALWAQSGRYACSTPQIDWIVDAACAVPGVLGAQIAGAGLGGCAMILARQEALATLMKTLHDGYYRPRGLPLDAHVCVPVAGSGLLKV
jgi:N-acetylgalactosamine kinase